MTGPATWRGRLSLGDAGWRACARGRGVLPELVWRAGPVVVGGAGWRALVRGTGQRGRTWAGRSRVLVGWTYRQVWRGSLSWAVPGGRPGEAAARRGPPGGWRRYDRGNRTCRE
ncbi:hypothetical protein GCM10009544_35180 [Streptomyces stramineus]|uniref:Uncharacterized protein n=1 Tax=Streptomyces stramineus TaxID=173861 RepID=A0ABN1A893_9ACTN